MNGAAGHFEDKTHILPVRIYYADTDLSSVVYHANYLAYMERGRSEFFRHAGIMRLAQLEELEPTAWTLRKVELEYLRPARVDDLIEVHTKLSHLSGARMNAQQDIYLNGDILTRGKIEACIITLSGKPRRIPQEMRDKLAPLLYETDT
jgi:acyl-CoA thioester hydrolase